MRPGQVPCALVSQKEILHRVLKIKAPKKSNRGEVLTMDIFIQSKESQVFHPVATVHCRYSSSSTLMTLDGIDGRGCCKTSEPNHFARPMGEPLLWLGRWSSCVCPWDNPVRGSTFWGVVCAPAGDPCAPEPVKCKAIRGGIITQHRFALELSPDKACELNVAFIHSMSPRKSRYHVFIFISTPTNGLTLPVPDTVSHRFEGKTRIK